MACRICLEEDGKLISPCACKGTTAYVHEECLVKWLQSVDRTTCEICHAPIAKTKRCSFQPAAYCMGCFTCSVDPNDVDRANAMSLYILMISTVFMVFTPIDDYLLLNAAFSISLVLSCMHALWYRIPAHNVLVRWRLCFTVPYLLSCLIQFLVVMGDCESQCYVYDQRCDQSCPVRGHYEIKKMHIDTSVFMELVNLLLVVVLRGMMLCFIYMRKVTLRDRTDEREKESLLSNDSLAKSARPRNGPKGINSRCSQFAIRRKVWRNGWRN